MLNHPKGNDQPACHSEERGGRGEKAGETGGRRGEEPVPPPQPLSMRLIQLHSLGP